jgi:hypothetical protein
MMMRIQFLLLILVGLTASADQHGDGPPNRCHIYYPNIPGELMLENDKLVVQRFIIEPGEWEGIHRHPPNQLYIHVKGTTSQSPDGEIGWSDTATEMSAMHESGNTGDEAIDLIWVTLKPGCMAPPAEDQ